MEKKKPHYSLAIAKAMIQANTVRTTNAARVGATALNLDYQGMLAVVTALTMRDFYKSMTTHADSSIWQDVYRPKTDVGDIYLKLTIIEDLLIVSFKEL